jgi:hypothetical protein
MISICRYLFAPLRNRYDIRFSELEEEEGENFEASLSSFARQNFRRHLEGTQSARSTEVICMCLFNQNHRLRQIQRISDQIT